MKNSMLGAHDSAPDSREVARGESLRVGRMPEVKRGDVVWVWFSERWLKARITRPLPGGVYMACLITYPANGTLTTVSANTFGGVAK